MSKKNTIVMDSENNQDIFDSQFINDIDRIKQLTSCYKNTDIAKAFAQYYKVEINDEVKNNKQINSIATLELGNIYSGSVKEITKNTIEFAFPGAKEASIICKESFASCMDSLQNYLATHDNKLMFEVREKKQDVYYVSIINAYYKFWVSTIEQAISHEDVIDVHIDELVSGGYVGTTLIQPLVQLTGKNYTSRIFIPGSHIVLNIEHDFNKWVGEDVKIVPQKFVEYRKDLKNGVVENCLVGSRKRMLQIIGMNNIYEIYQDYENAKKLAELANRTEVVYSTFEGIVTGIINSNGKTGIFIELKNKCITGLMPVDSYDLLDYKPGDEIQVAIKDFEVQKDKDPFVFNKKNKLVRANVRIVFEKV